MLFKSSVVNRAISFAFAFFLAFSLISSPSILLQRPWIAPKLVGSVVEGIINGLGGLGGFVSCAAGFPCLARGLGAIEGFEGPDNCAIWLSKWTLGLIDQFDLRSVCLAIID